MQHYIPIVCGTINSRFQHLVGYQTDNVEKKSGYVFVLDDDLLPILGIATKNSIQGWECMPIFIPAFALYASLEEAQQVLELVETQG